MFALLSLISLENEEKGEKIEDVKIKFQSRGVSLPTLGLKLES